ncbi:sulfocyanin-like copper-binding protein [Deinococcus sp.]|uniref:sulfocyanin-like copper-binding protein n=1 Tax=Deinococcus sp. TaxID=47478 RepID=UPI003CC6B969
MKKIILSTVLLLSASASAASYVTSDSASKTATIVVDANQGAAGGGLNFNGAVKGAKSFSIPAGWNVVMKFKNLGQLAHSAAVVKGSTPPASVTEKDAAFPGAYTKMLMQGLGANAEETVKFKASAAGSYLIVCGVPGHALGGQYLGLKVVPGAKAASYQ